MRMVDIIRKKRDGFHLTEQELSFLIEGYVRGEIPDYQMSAWAMAVYFQGMSRLERAAFTKAMSASGEQIDLSAINGIKVDKHSTGGVGDTTTLVLAPLVASVGVPVAKMSGRSLGHTGGTIDKLESIPGFRAELTKEDFTALVNQNKLAISGQTEHVTPADKKLYRLRDVTATVDSIPLLASSIMSKKIAAGADALVLDVKTGSGAFMQELNQAKQLAEAMVEIGTQVSMKTVAVISNMDEPLGYMIGNALEVKEALATLQGKGPEDLEELCLTLGSYMVMLAKKAETVNEAKELLRNAISSGKALHTFQIFIQSQGGDPTIIADPSKWPATSYQIPVPANEDGYVTKIAAEEIGTVAMILGAGRTSKNAKLDLSVGVELKKKVGDPVKKGEPLAILHSNKENPREACERLSSSFTIVHQKSKRKPLIYEYILSEN